MAKMNITKARKIVSIAYYTVLNRAPDSAGLNDWAKKLSAGTIDETDLYYSFFSSKEYQNLMKQKK